MKNIFEGSYQFFASFLSFSALYCYLVLPAYIQIIASINVLILPAFCPYCSVWRSNLTGHLHISTFGGRFLLDHTFPSTAMSDGFMC